MGYAIETDVRLSKDGELVLFHDDNLKRVCDVDRDVHRCTYAQLKTLSLDKTNEKIPTLDELLTLVDGQVPILLEIKTVRGADRAQYLQKIAQSFDGYRGEYAVQSFHPLLVKGYKKLRPHVPCGILTTANSKKEDFNGAWNWRLQAFAVKHTLLNFYVKPDFISYRAEDFAYYTKKRYKLPRLVWVVTAPEQEQALRPYSDNIIFEGYLPTANKS